MVHPCLCINHWNPREYSFRVDRISRFEAKRLPLWWRSAWHNRMCLDTAMIVQVVVSIAFAIEPVPMEYISRPSCQPTTYFNCIQRMSDDHETCSTSTTSDEVFERIDFFLGLLSSSDLAFTLSHDSVLFSRTLKTPLEDGRKIEICRDQQRVQRCFSMQ